MQIVLDLSQEPYFGILCRSTRRWQNHFRKSSTVMPVHAVSSAILAALTAEFVDFYVSSNNIPAIDIPLLTETVHRALQEIAESDEEGDEPSHRTKKSTIPSRRRARASLRFDAPIDAAKGIAWPSKIAGRHRLRRKPGRRWRRASFRSE